MPEQKTVIVLGAGASGAERAPLQHQLFSQFFRERVRSGPGNAELQRMRAELRAFFEFFFGIDTDLARHSKSDFPTFEEVLGIIELALQRSESFRSYSTSSANPSLQRIRDHLIFLICIILARRLKGPGEHHRRLVHTLHKAGELDAVTFISLNYDILIDNALTEAYDTFDRDLDYGVDFVNFDPASPGADEWRAPRHGCSSLLLKLHGSLNWLYCPTCVALTLTPKEKGVIRLLFNSEAARCRRCKTTATPIVIPPTFFKVTSNFHLQQIWHRAERVLSEANRLVFCGYSFPDADVHLKYLLKRVEVNRGSTPDVFIVNNHKGKRIAQKREEERRYKRFYNQPSKVHYTNLSFESFCRRGTASL
jgi:hypothetical protein